MLSEFLRWDKGSIVNSLTLDINMSAESSLRAGVIMLAPRAWPRDEEVAMLLPMAAVRSFFSRRVYMPVVTRATDSSLLARNDA
ncbi:hypothetical protein V7S43_007389 [Phytophthora oleae]|uniref:Uncharacterized protein n=1 Tax=Phytophthora oleae TaxID=2107226 RepID=A0ABD3FQF0_9STRA